MAVHPELIDRIREALGPEDGAPDLRLITALLERVHPSDLAAILDELTLPEAEQVFARLDDARAAEALSQVASATSRDLVQTSPPDRVARLLRLLPMDEAAELVAAAGDAGQRALDSLSEIEARDVEQLLEYPEQTAGRLMTSKFASVRSGTTIAQVFDHLRRVAPTVETVTTLYVLDDGDRLAGACSIRQLLMAPLGDPVDRIMRRDVVTVSPETDQQEVARVVGRYDFTAVPVVDGHRRLLGIVTVDDVIDILSEEFNEDYAGLVGAAAAEMDRRTPAQVARLRLPWLFGTMVIELLAGFIIARFDDVLRRVILLASFMPVISAVSGNVGLQAAAIVVRGLDTGHISVERWVQAVRRELVTALTIALAAGTILAAVATAWSRHLPFGLVVGAAMTCSILTAGFLGTAVPMLSRRLGFDPAVTAGPFETAFQDVVGFTVFLWMASLMLHWLV